MNESASGRRRPERLDPMDIPEIAGWSAAFGGGSNSTDFLSYHFSGAQIFAVGTLFFPLFVEYRGCVVLKERFVPDNIDRWLSETLNRPSAVERVVNKRHLWDLVRQSEDPTPLDARVLREIRDMMKSGWASALELQFPGRTMVVEVSDEPDDYGPTVTAYSG